MARRVKKGPGPKRAKSKPGSDASKLLWLEVMTPMKLLEQDVNARLLTVQQVLVERMAKQDGVDLADGWVYNAGTSRWEMPHARVG